MPTYLSFEYAHDDPLPPGADGEFRTPDALVEHFLSEYTAPGDRVVDPFAGYGTTLAVAERLDRVPYGIEYEPDRVEYVRERLSTPEHVRQGSVLDLDSSWFPDCEMAFTSPPFMEQTDTRNPFENYAGESDYESYLDDVETAFSRLDGVLVPGATVVVDVANMKYRDRVTTLAWDLADRVGNVFHFDGEVVVTWERSGGDSEGDGDGDDANSSDSADAASSSDSADDRNGRFGYGYDHSYCLVFAKRDG